MERVYVQLLGHKQLKRAPLFPSSCEYGTPSCNKPGKLNGWMLFDFTTDVGAFLPYKHEAIFRAMITRKWLLMSRKIALHMTFSFHNTLSILEYKHL